jgi:PTH1 family peptidyl-tRNA hydrolase
VEAPGWRFSLLKPQSFMNLSGEPVSEWMRYHRFEPGQLVVVHDELDLPLGAVKLKLGGGDAGHNGLRSMTRCLGTGEYYRIRLGIGRPGQLTGGQQKGGQADGGGAPSPARPVVGHVLGRFDSMEEQTVADVLRRAREALMALVRDGLKSAQNKFNV